MKKTITIKDIAKELGIHHTTVSRALREINSVKKETRNKILEKANELGYRPNRLAQEFRNKRSNTIVIIVPVIQHSFFSEFISDFSKKANTFGFSVMVFQSDGNLKIEKKIIDNLLSYRISGVVASVSNETKSGEHFELLKDVMIPHVFFDRAPENIKASYVILDNFQAAYDAVKVLIDSGRKRIAFISTPDQIKVFNDRFSGYKKALEDNRMPLYDQMVIYEGLSMKDGFNAAQKLLALTERPDAILAIRDELAIGVIKFLKKSGMRVPDDIAVIGFDNDPMGIACEPELTTISQLIPEMAATAFDLLLSQINNNTHEMEQRILKGEIILRGSS
jgi:LacI family transcriptional regulator